jgi:hypothetical protein
MKVLVRSSAGGSVDRLLEPGDLLQLRDRRHLVVVLSQIVGAEEVDADDVGPKPGRAIFGMERPEDERRHS